MRATLSDGIVEFLNATKSIHNGKDADDVRRLIRGVDEGKWPLTFAANECNVSRQQFHTWREEMRKVM